MGCCTGENREDVGEETRKKDERSERESGRETMFELGKDRS